MKNNTVCRLFLGLITFSQALAQDLSQRDQLVAKNEAVLKELQELKMEAFGVPGFSDSQETLTVE